jgi:hypothetical protein
MKLYYFNHFPSSLGRDGRVAYSYPCVLWSVWQDAVRLELADGPHRNFVWVPWY